MSWKSILKVELINWDKRMFIQNFDSVEVKHWDYGQNGLSLTVGVQDLQYTPNNFNFTFLVVESDERLDGVEVNMKVKVNNAQNAANIKITNHTFSGLAELESLMIDSKYPEGRDDENSKEYDDFDSSVNEVIERLRKTIYEKIEGILDEIAINYAEYGGEYRDSAKTRDVTDKTKGEAWRSVIQGSRKKGRGKNQTVEHVQKMLEEIENNWSLRRDEQLPPFLIKYFEENGEKDSADTTIANSKNGMLEVYLFKDIPDGTPLPTWQRGKKASAMEYDIEVSFSPRSTKSANNRKSSGEMSEALDRISGTDSMSRYYANNDDVYAHIVEAHEYSTKKWKGLLLYLKTE